ncbi:CoB--CoM heterodisulfide reductase [Thermincola ferriacetica]|uniref:CoB--CoM heterodisulfide reductase n=2 Tax=Thermincola TaxID=278993 RepID=D5X883_THEPJ|nr:MULTISPECIES: CoB--CoM heterodisulfide reductase iron-sulfur subunit B family protein [Thermincola]ADG82803.1 CoB--CoM heterodisulfide reductase [Thermincola potens JR]KNZ70264.1 CoB--CoM heterodisulfide reductase [Thermincola ferriacetica]
MKYAYYPGCSLHSTAKGFDMSVKAVCKALDIELWEIPDWACCGASSAHSFGHLLGLAVPAKTLVPAEKEGLDVVAPCAACWQRLIWVNHEINTSPEMREKINKAIGAELKGTSKVLTVFEAFANQGMEKIAEKVKKPLKGLKVASYYGCYYVKPPKVAHVDDAENPHIMDDIVAALGAEPVDWPFKTECCGASLSFVDLETTNKMSGKVVEMAVKSGADIIVTACPVCQLNLDMQQTHINKVLGTNFNMPVAYISQLMGYAMGFSDQDLGMNKNYTAYQAALAKIG